MSGNTPLRFVGVAAMLDREYRNAPAYQWGRELVRNGIEADATTIQIGVEWQAVASRGVYRLQYADDGCGMTREQLRKYMHELGKGSKIVGGAHDNYALGCRMTLLPWNPEGVVVISLVDGDMQMVRMMYDAAADEGEGEYVLEEVDWEDEDGDTRRSTVYPPYVDPDDGIDWADVLPDFVKEAGHGTTFVMLGRSATDDTLDGDAERGESLRILTRKYFNTRFWSLPTGVSLRCVEFTKPADRSTWPTSETDTGLYQYRAVKGAEEVVEHTRRSGDGTIEDSGVVALRDKTMAHWWLREPDVDTGGVGSASGFIAVRYRGELYGHAYANHDDGDTRAGSSVYRQFGIGNDAVRKRVFVVVEPPEYDEATERPGVAPSTGRADLYWLGAGLSPRSVKPSDWADDFAENMPDAIEAALNAAHEDESEVSAEREERLKRVMDRLSKRWRVKRARVVPEADDTTTKPATPGSAPRTRPDVPVGPRRRKSRKRVVVRGRDGAHTLGEVGSGTEPAKTTRVQLGYPDYEWVTADDIADEGMIAAWQSPNKAHPNGLVQIDEAHPVITGQIEYWAAQYPKAVSPQVRKIVMEAYADVAVAKVAHMHAITGPVVSEDQRDHMLQNPSLTASLLGLLGEDAVISPRLGGIGTKRKRSDQSAGTDDNEMSA